METLVNQEGDALQKAGFQLPKFEDKPEDYRKTITVPSAALRRIDDAIDDAFVGMGLAVEGEGE
jgi:hypothetical protein